MSENVTLAEQLSEPARNVLEYIRDHGPTSIADLRMAHVMIGANANAIENAARAMKQAGCIEHCGGAKYDLTPAGGYVLEAAIGEDDGEEVNTEQLQHDSDEYPDPERILELLDNPETAFKMPAARFRRLDVTIQVLRRLAVFVADDIAAVLLEHVSELEAYSCAMASQDEPQQ